MPAMPNAMFPTIDNNGLNLNLETGPQLNPFFYKALVMELFHSNQTVAKAVGDKDEEEEEEKEREDEKGDGRTRRGRSMLAGFPSM